MAKDTEKLIRQLSLISYLMAERRPVTAPEIRRDVEGYSVMNEDAFARRFYADRSELEALGIVLSVEKPQDGQVEQENYSLPPENFHLPAIEFTDDELAALWTALYLLDGKFAYAEPLRLALQQISWGRPSPLDSPVQRTIALGITGAADGHEVSQRLAKIETAIFRRKTIVFDYYTMERDATGAAQGRPLPAAVPGRPVLRRRPLARARRDPRLPALPDPGQGRLRDQGRARLPAARRTSTRAPTPTASSGSSATRSAPPRSGSRAGSPGRSQRHFGRYGELRPAEDGSGSIFATPYSNARQLIAWVLGLGENARIVGPPELAAELRERVHDARARATAATRTSCIARRARAAERAGDESSAPAGAGGRQTAERRELGADAAIRPERFARLVTLASILIDAGRSGRRSTPPSCASG